MKYLVIPSQKYVKSNIDFLFPIKGFSVGFFHTWDINELPLNSYIYVNRLLDTQSILELEEILKGKIFKGIVFEDVGIFTVLGNISFTGEKILYLTHGLTSSKGVASFLEFADSVVLANDLTKEEMSKIIAQYPNKVSLYTYGPLPYMYSRRNLLTNFQKEFSLKTKHVEVITTDGKAMKAIENEYGTVVFDNCIYDGRELLNTNVKYHLINLDWDDVGNIDEWLSEFPLKKFPNSTSGFLHQKTIYRLPPKGEDK